MDEPMNAATANGSIMSMLKESLMTDTKKNFSPEEIIALQSLIINESNVELLQQPSVICAMRNLEVLHLRVSYSKVRTETLPDFIGTLLSLRGLYLDHCLFLRQLPSTIGGLRNLQHLRLRCNAVAETLPHCIGELQALETLSVECCGAFHSLPSSIGKLDKLKSLVIFNCPMTDIPNSIGNLKSLETLSLESSTELTLPDTIGELINLKSLRIALSVNAADVIGDLMSLEKLDLIDCDLPTLPTAFSQWGTLRELDISNSSFESLPDSIGCLSSLQILRIACRRLRRLPTRIGGLQALVELDIKNCDRITSLPSEIGLLKSLERLNILDCASMVVLPQELGQLWNLKSICLVGCGIYDWECIPLPPKLLWFNKGHHTYPPWNGPPPHFNDMLIRFLKKNHYVMSLGTRDQLSQEVKERLDQNRFKKFLPGGDYSVPPPELPLVLETINRKVRGNTLCNSSLLFGVLQSQPVWWQCPQ